MTQEQRVSFVMLDIKQLYPCMRCCKILAKIRRVAGLVGYKEQRARALIVEIERCILGNTFMLVETATGWSLIHQQEGSISGSNHAVTEANIYMQDYEHKLYEKLPSALLDYLWFVDDDFAVMTG